MYGCDQHQKVIGNKYNIYNYQTKFESENYITQQFN